MNNRGIELVNVAPYMREKTKLKELADKAEVPTDNAKRLIAKMLDDKNGHKREPKPPPPEGGISLRAAERKYGVKHATLSIWTRKGYLPIILRTKNELYIDEAILAELANIFKQNPGRGKWTIKQNLNTS